MLVGILALQGAVEPHAEKLHRLGARVKFVKNEKDLTSLSGIILPGGESTTMLHLLNLNHLWKPLADFVSSHPTWGLCAGAILLAREVAHPHQASLGSIDIEVTRNAYGRHIDSFVDHISPTSNWPDSHTQEAVFIRAPKFTKVGSRCKILFEHQGYPVAVQQDNKLAMSYHPELSLSDIFHKYFMGMIHG